MAARKLQTEIDRTLKKVAEGVELFEGIYDKMQASTNQTQKEKLELDLKTQIKKLQRLRDQIKTWVASNDIKDKSQLLENRRLIETQMEKFKACEKEMKTKAFSKEGLTQAAKLDPKEQEKEEAMQWLQSMVEELQMQVEAAEAQVEALQSTGKKKKASNTAGRMEELEQLNDRRKWHISRLEIILRLLNNGSLTTDRVNALKDDVQYFVESNTEEDFDEDEGIYDELRLDEEEEKFGLLNDEDDASESASEDLPPRTPVKHKHEKEKDKEKDVEHKREQESPVLKKANISLRKPSVDAKPPPNFVQQPMSSILKAGLSTTQPAPRPPAQLPPIKYAQMAAQAVNQSTPSTAQPTTTPSTSATTVSASQSTPQTAPSQSPSIPPSTSDQQSHAPSSPSFTHPSVTSPMMSSAASVSQIPDGSLASEQQSPSLSEAVAPSSRSGSAAAASPQKLTAARKESVSSDSQAAAPVAPPGVTPPADTTQTQQLPATTSNGGPATSPLPQQLQASVTPATPGAGATASPAPIGAQPVVPPGVKPPTSQSEGMLAPPQPGQQTQQQQRNLTSLSDLVVSYENAKQKANVRMSNLDQVHKMLEGGYSNLPQPADTDKPKYYVPRNPYQTPAYYPQVPHPYLSTPRAFTNMDVETLFYVFYYLPGTYQQFLAARELKRQSWRFHVKYLTWFQRHSEPQAITEEYEQGVYVYFDWEGSWCQRKKSDFRFEYRYLSED
ncbi:Not1 N-terminal domain, CCR4-Not complex component-domain-containing protein [Schizophyllum commune]